MLVHLAMWKACSNLKLFPALFLGFGGVSTLEVKSSLMAVSTTLVAYLSFFLTSLRYHASMSIHKTGRAKQAYKDEYSAPFIRIAIQLNRAHLSQS